MHIGLSAKELGGASALGRAAATPSGRGNAYGTASAALAGAMALLASPPVRHRWFLLFKLSHLILFPAVLTLACLHATVLVGYVLPPAILYALDRLLSWWTARRELAGVATALPCGAVRLVVSTPAGFAVAPGQWAYVHVAAASGLEWHPFSLACAATETAAGSGAPATSVQFLIRARDKAGGGAGFGARLAALASPPAGAAVRVRLDGPLGRPPLPLHGYDCVLFVAGGVGVTPCVSHLAALVSLRGAEGAERRAAAAAGAKGDSGATTAAPPPPAAAPPPFRPQALRLLWVLPSAAPAAEWLPGWLPALAAAGVTVTVAVTRAGFGGGPLPAPVFGDGGDGDGGAGSVEYVAGRPDVGAAADLAAAAAGPGGCSAVFACGPRGLVEAAAGAAAAAGCAFAHETFGL